MNTALVTGACINTGVALVEKFAKEGWDVVFTGRDANKVAVAEKTYREKYPDVRIWGYTINSLLDERTVDEQATKEMFDWLDEMGIFVETLVLNAADQELIIPMNPNCESLNAAVAATIVMWQIKYS